MFLFVGHGISHELYKCLYQLENFSYYKNINVRVVIVPRYNCVLV